MVRRIIKAVAMGIGALIEVLWSLLGLLGTAAVGYGWAQTGTIGGGINFFIKEFSKFFDDNRMNPLLNALRDLFEKYVEVFSKYPWAHLAVLFLGILFILRKYRNVGRFVRSVEELIHTAEEPGNFVNLQGRVVPNAPSRAMASARTDRKIGFERENEVVDTQGMPSILASHTWGRKGK